MPTPTIGELRPLASGWEARIRIDDNGARRGFALVLLDEGPARERCTAMAQIAVRLRRAGHADKIEKLLEMAAKARAGKPWDAVIAAVDLLTGGRTAPNGEQVAVVTVKDFGDDWRDGTLHKKYPDHVEKKKDSSVKRDEICARCYVDKELGDMPIADVELEDCERMMATIPEERASSTRRQVAQYIRRLLAIAVYPARLRRDNPIPKGWLPKARNTKAKECLYPDEDRTLLASSAPLLRRLAFGVLDREGMRTEELAQLTWSDVDVERGRIALDENKTDDPRDWDLEPGVWRALKTWRERYQPGSKDVDRVFALNGLPINVERLAEQLRRDLKNAGVTREKLFERSETRQPIRAHDLRATFITIALATGKTETWVADRTGHTSSTMINRYRRKARGWKLGPLDALDEAIPELRPTPSPSPHERPDDEQDDPIPGRLDHESAEIPAECLVASGEGSRPKSTASANSATGASERNLPASPKDDERERGSTERVPHEHGAMRGALDVDPVEAALAKGIELASVAQRFDVVAQLAKELEARRLARSSNVIALDADARRRGRR